MRRFSSYGPVDKDLHYYTTRSQLIDIAYQQLIGEDPSKGGHYITIWAARQSGKTWLMQQVVERIRRQDDFEIAILTLQFAKKARSSEEVLNILCKELSKWFERPFPMLHSLDQLPELFTKQWFQKPLILILDEFDALDETLIEDFASQFRSIYTQRLNQSTRETQEKSSLLHGLALIGVRSVLGIENVSGSPFNIQRSVHIPNLTLAEVEEMFAWYSRESGQQVEQAVVEQLFAETRGQPGLVGWFGELLTERFRPLLEEAITLDTFEEAYAAAIQILPNNNILNIISKAKQEPYQQTVLDLFKIDQKVPFSFDDPNLSFLYTNGVIDYEREGKVGYVVRFASPFVQKRLFNYFARQLFPHVGTLHAPFEDLSDTITEQGLQIGNLVKRYEQYLQNNRDWLFKHAPRRITDLHIFEAVYHFNLFLYLSRFLDSYGGRVTPEFPTGNGQLDLLIDYANQRFGLEVKSFSNQPEYNKALKQAAGYGKQLGLSTMYLLLFVERVDDVNRCKYEAAYQDATTKVTVIPLFVVTG